MEGIKDNSVQDIKTQDESFFTPKIQIGVRVVNLLVFIACLLVNYLIGAKSNAVVSDAYVLAVTPPGLFFTIWIVIFTLLCIASVYQTFKGFWPMKTHFYFFINSLLLIVWNLVFVEGSLAAVSCDFLIIVVMVAITFFLWRTLQVVEEDWKFYATRLFIAFYLGWIIAATNLNFGIVLVYLFKATKYAQMIVFWIMAPSCAIGAFVLNGVLQGRKGLLSCFSLWLSVGWGFAGAGIRSSQFLNS